MEDGAILDRANPNAKYWERTYVGKNSETFNNKDIVNVDGSNHLQVFPNSTDGIPLGVISAPFDGLDMDSDNETNAKDRPAYLPNHEGVYFKMVTDGNAASLDTAYQLEGGSGAQKVDVSAGSSASGPVVVRRTEGNDLEGDEVIVELRQS